MKEFFKKLWAYSKQTDKRAHFAFSFMIAAFLFIVINEPHYAWHNIWEPAAFGAITSLAVGVLKELFDWHRGEFSWWDIAFDVLGILFFMLAVILCDLKIFIL